MQVSEYNNIDPYSQKVTIINLSGFAYWIGSSLIGYGLKTTTTPTKFRSFELPQSKKKKKKRTWEQKDCETRDWFSTCVLLK